MQTMWDKGNNWGLWRLENDKSGRPTKKPKNPHTGFNADPSDISTWGTSAEAESRNSMYPVDPTKGGLAFMLVDNMAGIDIDAHDVDKNPLQDEILELMGTDTYIEYSPSGKGIHILFRVDKSRLPLTDEGKWDFKRYYNNNRELDVECYVAGTTNRYLTFTQNMFEGCTSLDMTDKTDEFLTFIDRYMKKKPTNMTFDDVRRTPVADMTIEQILDRARKGQRGDAFSALYDDGNISGYASHSEADLALCDRLAWWFNGDYDKINEAFQASALMRDKWDEPHGATTYGDMTIQKAISETQGGYDPFGGTNTHTGAKRPSESLSEAQDGIRSKPIFDLDALRDYLDEKGIVVKFNDITQRTFVEGFDPNISQTDVMSALPSHIYGELARRYKRVTTGNIREFIDALAMDRRNHFNPVLDYFEGKDWDGYDYLSDLYSIMGIQDDWLSKRLVKKWIMQGWALLHNDHDHPFGCEGVLTLAGPQGIGKTTFFSVMACKPEFFRAGQSINSRDKDNERRIITTWIAELGELDCTFKSDVGKVKQFITNEYDEYRLPYGHTDKCAPRRTNMGATVNGDRFLIDETGNRRFWTVPLTDVDTTALRAFKKYAHQVWLQVWVEERMDRFMGDNEAMSACFRLDNEEFEALKVRNGMCEKPMKAEDEIRDILAEIEADPRHYTKQMTAKQFKQEHIEVLRNYSDTEIGKVLNKLGYKTLNDGKLMTVDGHRGRFRELPYV